MCVLPVWCPFPLYCSPTLNPSLVRSMICGNQGCLLAIGEAWTPLFSSWRNRDTHNACFTPLFQESLESEAGPGLSEWRMQRGLAVSRSEGAGPRRPQWSQITSLPHHPWEGATSHPLPWDRRKLANSPLPPSLSPPE